MPKHFNLHLLEDYEVWFFQVHFGIHALRVQWTRSEGEQGWHIQIFLQHSKGDHVFERWDTKSPDWLSSLQTKSDADAVEWDLTLQPGNEWMIPQPLPLRKYGLGKLELKCLTDVLFSGSIKVKGKRYELNKAIGSIGNFYGKGSPTDWWLLCASAFEEPGYSLCAVVQRRKVWGRSGFVCLQTPDQQQVITAPLARLNVQKGEPDVQISFKPLFDKKVEIRASGHHFVHPEPGIKLSMLSDLWVYVNNELICSCLGKAVTERRLIQ